MVEGEGDTMPSPISSASPSNQTPPVEVNANPAPVHVITIEPVVIVGDAGAQQLVKQHDAACRTETAKSVEGTLPMALDVVGVLTLSAITPLAIGVGLAKLFHDSIKEGAELRGLYDCKTK